METTEARRESKDILFRRVGVDLPLSEGSEAFTDANAPVRGLAVSNRFGISFFVHSAGFVVTQTSSLVEVAQQAKDGSNDKTAQQGCYLNVPVSGVRILDLSNDELTLAACVGDRAVHLYDVPSLIRKLDKTPLESRDISEGRVKDFRWSPADGEIYVLLSREGHLFSGRVGQAPSRVVDKGVIAVSWSPDGKHVSYLTSELAVCVCNSKFESQYTFNLPAEIGDVTENLQGESLQWIRPDAMLVAYIQTNEEEEEEECPLILVTSRDGDLGKEGGTITGVVFDNTFPSIDSRVIPAGSGPYMLAEYIKPWEMAIAASRRSVDDHIVILGWFSEEKKHEALSIELTNDTWLPRIELQENGDDNVLLGLAVGMTTTELNVTDPRDDSGDTDLPACPVLMCLSLGGKLSLFSVARLDESASAATLVSPPSNLPESNRAEVKSNTSVDMPAMVPQAVRIDKESPGLQDARIKQAEERIEDERSLSSGSETDRENDGNLNAEVLPRFPSQGSFGSLLETQRKSLSMKDSSFVSAKDTSPVSSLQTPGASALSSLASTGSSNINSLSTAKSAPSGLDRIQQTGSTPQLPVTLTRTVSQVQSPSSQTTTFPQSTPFPSQSSSSLKHSQSSGPSLFGQAGNDKGSGQFTSSFQPSSSSSLSSALSSGSLRPQQSSGFGLFGQAGNDKGTSSQSSSSFLPMGTPASLSSGSLRPQQSSGFGLFGQAGNDKGTSSQSSSSFLPMGTPASLSSGSLRPQQSSGVGFDKLIAKAGHDKGTRTPTSTQKPSPLERGPQTGPQKIPASGARTLAVTSARQSGVSEPEQAFIVELEKIKKMADEVDNLMAYIEGRGQRTASNQPPCFTKQSLNELELGIRTLADNCKTVKERVEEERHSLNNLRDENLQVDAWRLYVQSLAEQAAENRHQELWCRRKLTPDLDVKRKRVTKSEQALKQQIAALEEHVHHLELDNRKRVISLKDGKNNLNRQSSTGRSQSIQNLYSTVNGLLSSADRLSQQVSQQMEALNISAQPQTSQKIMKSVGLSSEDTLHMQSRPSFSRAAASPLARQQSIHSPALKAELGLPIHTTPPRRTMPSDSGVGAPSVTRRRRDSMDGVQKALALAGGASPKTTIERVSYHTPSQQPNPSSTSSNMLVKHIRQRSFQESSEESSAPPRHVRRVLSSQTRSATSSPAPSLSTPENRGPSVSSGFSANSAISSLQGSQSSATLFEQQSGDGRPDSKRASPRNASSFAEKSVPTIASRFGPPPGRTTTTQTTALSSSSNAASGSLFPSLSNAPSPSVFKFTINNPPNAASSFSFATPSATKPAVPLEPSGKPASNMGTTETFLAGSSTKFPSSPSPVFGSAGSTTMSGSMSTTKLAIESTKFGVDPNSTFLVDSGKDERPGFGFKAASFGTPSFGTPSFSSSSFSRSSLTGPIQDATTPSPNSFTLSAPTTRVPGSREGDTGSHKNDAKQALPLTPAAQTISNQSTVGKATGNPELSSNTTVNQTIPTPSSVAPSSAAKSTLFGTQASTTVAAPSNLLASQAQGGLPPSSLNVPASTPNLKTTSSPVGNMLFAPTSSPSTTPSSSSQTPFVFPAASTPAATFSVPPITTPDTDEEDMDEEQVAGGTTSLGGFNLGGLGLGSSTPAPSQAPKTNLFGNLAPFGTQSTSSAFGTQQTASVFGTQPTSSAFSTQPSSSAFGTQPTSSVFGTQPTSSAFGKGPTSSAFGTSSPQGQLFRPPSFSLPSAQSPPQSSGGFGFGNPSPSQSGASPFGSAFGSTTANPPGGSPFGPTPGGTTPAFGSPGQPGAGGFGQPSQLGPGQQALGSALGTFGQTRQMGFGSTTPFGSTPSSGFGSAASGGGFPSAGMGGGFANAGSGGFASASTGGGFAGAATGGGFAGAAGASGGGFSGVTGGGGFQAFGGNSIGSGGFGGAGQSAFGTTSPPVQSLFTQMRK